MEGFSQRLNPNDSVFTVISMFCEGDRVARSLLQCPLLVGMVFVTLLVCSGVDA